MKPIIISLMLILTPMPSFAGQTVNVTVNGMVCDFCAQGLEKVFGKKEAVEKIDVSLNENRVTVFLKDGKNLSDDVIKESIVGNGFSVVELERK